jgi:hypothetical protein
MDLVPIQAEVQLRLLPDLDSLNFPNPQVLRQLIQNNIMVSSLDLLPIGSQLVLYQLESTLEFDHQFQTIPV